MKTIALCVVGIAALTFGLWPRSIPQSQQGDPKAEIKTKHRDARYTDPGRSKEKGWPGYSKMKDRSVGTTQLEFFDIDSEELSTPERKAAFVNRLTVEHAAKRKSVICDATVIVYGKVKSNVGHFKSDDSSIYTVYNFVIDDVYRAPRELNLTVGSEIEVTAPGGFAKTENGKVIGIKNPMYPMFPPKMNHILALKYDAEADDYYVFDPIGIYRIALNGVVVRADSKQEHLAKRARLANEPTTFDAITSEMKSTVCQQ